MRKMTLMATLLIGFTTFINAASINITDTIKTNTVWNSDTVRILKHIVVDSGITLTIKPGTTVLFDGNCAIWVNGSIVAEGTVTDSVSFTTWDTAIGWHGIRYDETDTLNNPSSFSYCNFSYGKADSATNLGCNECGGALYFNNFHKASIRNCCFHHNYASAGGGALYCVNRANIEVLNCTFWNNSARYGGAIGINHVCKLYVANCEIRENRATNIGGGLYVLSNDRSTFVNCIVTNNTATESGGAGYIRFYSYTRFYNCTISNNIAGKRGGAFYIFEFMEPIFGNTIIWGNWAPEGPLAWIYDGDSHPEFRFCVAENSRNGIEGNGYGRFDTVSVEDPLFVDTANGNYALSAGSPCINAGTAVFEDGWELPPYDFMGNKRINENIVDIGAIEYTGVIGTAAKGRLIGHKNRQNFFPVRINDGCITIDLSAFTKSESLPNLTVNIYSLSGKLIYTFTQADIQTLKIQLKDLDTASGIYFVELKNGYRQLSAFSVNTH